MANFYASYPPVPGFSGGSGVTSLNGEVGALTLVAGNNVTITPSGFNLTIDAADGLTPSQTVVTDSGGLLTTIPYAIDASASTFARRDSQGNIIFNNSVSNVNVTVSAGSTTTLTSASALEQLLSGTLNQTFILPDATTLRTGWNYELNNNSTGILTTKDNGGTTLHMIPTGGWVRYILTNTATAAGVWDSHLFGPANATWGSSLLSVVGAIQVDVSAPEVSAILQLDSTSRGLLPPRMTTTQKNAIASPAIGLVVFDTTADSLSTFTSSGWQLAPVSADFIVHGNYALTGDLSVDGDMNVTGDLTNTGGFALTVLGDLKVGGTFNFTPTSTATTQSNVMIGGNMTIGVDSEFKVNPGQSPSLTIGGDFIGSAYIKAFNGSGQPEANGLSITVANDAVDLNITLNGGDSAGVANAGNGGNLSIAGDANAIDFTSLGGNSAHDGFNAGSGGALTIFGNLSLDAFIDISGGSSTSVTLTDQIQGAQGGSIYVGMDLGSLAGGTVSANGGATTGNTFQGGNGGHVVVEGIFEFGSLSLNGGAQLGSTGGGATVGGTAGTCGTGLILNVAVSMKGGDFLAGTGGTGGNLTGHLGSSITSADLSGGMGTFPTQGNGGNLSLDRSAPVDLSLVNVSGDTPGTVLVGSAVASTDTTITGDTTVQEDCSVNGNLICTTGRALTVFGDLRLLGGLNFTPTLTTTTQFNVVVHGDFNFGATSQFKVNPGQNPSLTVLGSVIGANFENFDGSGQPTANGLSVNIAEHCTTVSWNLSGGNSTNAANAGHGGNLTINGIATQIDLNASGGNSANSGFSAGNGGTCQIFGGVSISSGLFLQGGALTASAPSAGSGGFIEVDGSSVSGTGDIFVFGGNGFDCDGGSGGHVNLNCENYRSITASGGDVTSSIADHNGGAAGVGITVTAMRTGNVIAIGGAGFGTTGNGGAGGTWNAPAGDMTFTVLNLTGGASGGSSGTGGAAGSISVPGTLTITGSLLLQGGADNGGTGGNGGNIDAGNLVAPAAGINLSAGGPGGSNGAAAIDDQTRVNTLSVANAASATIAVGTLANKIEVFDKDGNSLGFVPVYTTIT